MKNPGRGLLSKLELKTAAFRCPPPTARRVAVTLPQTLTTTIMALPSPPQTTNRGVCACTARSGHWSIRINCFLVVSEAAVVAPTAAASDEQVALVAARNPNGRGQRMRKGPPWPDCPTRYDNRAPTPRSKRKREVRFLIKPQDKARLAAHLVLAVLLNALPP